MKSNLKFCATFASMIIGATLLVGAASADVPTQVVKFDDLNLQSTSGADRLYARIHAAARQVCDTGRASHDLGIQARTESCMHEAEDRAVRQINSDVVTALYQNRTGRSVVELASLAAN